MKRIVPLGLASLALVAAACGGGGAPAASSGDLGHQTPKEVLTTALAAATSSGTVHFQLLGTEGGKTESIVGDASGSDGREIITAGTVKIEALVVGGAAFVEGNAGGLEDQMELSAADAATYAGKWISIASTDAPYASLTKAVTLASTLSELRPTGTLTLTAPTTKASKRVVGVHGNLPGGAVKGTTGSATLYVSTAHPTVPIVFDAVQTTSGTKETSVGTFTNWGKPLDLTAPTTSVAFSSLPVPTTPTTVPAG
jgi:hypothetical protein